MHTEELIIKTNMIPKKGKLQTKNIVQIIVIQAIKSKLTKQKITVIDTINDMIKIHKNIDNIQILVQSKTKLIE